MFLDIPGAGFLPCNSIRRASMFSFNSSYWYVRVKDGTMGLQPLSSENGLFILNSPLFPHETAGNDQTPTVSKETPSLQALQELAAKRRKAHPWCQRRWCDRLVLPRKSNHPPEN